MRKTVERQESSGNLYADLGLPDAQERSAKMKIAIQINKVIEHKKLNQTQAAQLLDIDQPKISALSQGKIACFSFERLFRFLTILDHDVTVSIKAPVRECSIHAKKKR